MTINHNPPDHGRRIWLLRVCLLVAVWPLLAGCLLISGEQTTISLQGDSGNLSTQFVSAEGSADRTLKVADGQTTVQVIAIVAIETGDLELSLIDPDDAVVFTVAGQPDSQVTRSSTLPTDDRGQIRYRVVAQGARNGSYQLFFQP